MADGSGLVRGLSLFGIHARNLSSYPVTGSRYLVLTNSSMLGFSKISGIMLKSTNVLAINEGGIERPYLVRQSQSGYNTLTLEKGYGTYEIMRAMANMRYMLIIIRDHAGYMKGAYYLDDAVVKDVSLSALEAKSSNVLIQSMTIAYHSLKRQDKLSTFAPLANSALQRFGIGIGPVLNTAESYVTKDGAEARKAEDEREQYAQSLKDGTTAAQTATNPDIAEAVNQNNSVDTRKEEQTKTKEEMERLESESIENSINWSGGEV